MVKTELFSQLTTKLETYSFKDKGIIYQVELVGGICNLKCKLCPVTKGEAKRKENYFKVDFLEKMYRRGDFDNTFYTELQMYGEPLLHPKFDEAVRLLKSFGLKVGVSTNGTVWREGLKKVDFITLSSDSILYRKGRDEEIFSKVFEKILKETEAKIDIQVVEVEDWKKQIKKLEEKVSNYKEKVLIRTVPDCFVEEEKTQYQDFCMNPHLSVSIHSDGDVVPCCFEWGKQLVIGNIYKSSLEEIWNGKRRKFLIKNWIEGNLPKKCKFCKFRSPILLHYRFWINWGRKSWL